MALELVANQKGRIDQLWEGLPTTVKEDLFTEIETRLAAEVADEAYENAAILRDALKYLGKKGDVSLDIGKVEGVLAPMLLKACQSGESRKRSAKLVSLLGTPLGSGLAPVPGSAPAGKVGVSMTSVDRAFREGRLVREESPLDPFNAEVLVSVWERAVMKESAIRSLPPDQQKLAFPIDHGLAAIVEQWASIAGRDPEATPKKLLERWIAFAKSAVGELRRSVAEIGALGYNDEAAYVQRTWAFAFSEVLSVLMPMVNRELPKDRRVEGDVAPDSLAGVEAMLKALLVAVSTAPDAAFASC